MALVAYDYSDSEGNSEGEEEAEENANVVIPPANTDKTEKKNGVIKSITDDTIEDSDSEDVQPNTSMFAALPQSQTVTAPSIGESELEDFIPRAQKPDKPRAKVKITIPSLSDFKEDEDEPAQKKVKPSEKGSGLLSILPPVKGTPLSNKSFVPQSVSSLKNKPAAPKGESSKALIPHAVRKKQANAAATIKAKATSTKSSQGDESEDDEDIELPETFDDEMWEKVCGRPKPKQIIQEEEPDEAPSQYVDIAPEPAKPYTGLDNEAFKELVGRKRTNQNINIIDIHEDEILPEKDLWMTKSLTDPEMAPKKVIENPVDPTRRRKHHITYLAEQAKANEQELQNQWAASKFNRNASRAKYGF